MLNRTILFDKEEKLKECVYQTFDDMTSRASDGLRSKKDIVQKGAYEDQSAFMEYGQLSQARRKKHETEILIKGLYHKPYFSHIEAGLQGLGNGTEHYFLSDSETLDSVIRIGSGIEGYLIPFKLDKKRPISKALFTCYQSKKGNAIDYQTPDGTMTLMPELICDTDIEGRTLYSITPLYPKPEEEQMTFDEMLESRLQENRNNPALRNIISTLQARQFEIIGADVGESFVVQGCAGSGKSQCLLHRLFFLRDQLSEDGWEKVLLITPTQLFREYSADLMKRYQLSDVHNCSISDLYRSLLNTYDKRFRDRQYVFEMTEEYLPDGYLHSVYNDDNVRKIIHEINSAIRKYVRSGCASIGESVPDRIDADTISQLINRIDEKLAAIESVQETLTDNIEYQNKRAEYEALVKAIERNKKSQIKYQEELGRVTIEEEKLRKLISDAETIQQEKEEWVSQRKQRIQGAILEFEKAARKMDLGTDLRAPANYARKLNILEGLTFGEQYHSDENEMTYFDELIKIAYEDIKKEIGDKNPKNVIARHVKRKKEIEERLSNLANEIEEDEKRQEQYAEWLREAAGDFKGEKEKNTLMQSEMQQSRYFLSRIESTVFEREVWNALAPLKRDYGIKTIDTEELKDGKRKESRILYKSDLLFYMMIYYRLHPETRLPRYSYICIDEGQDLHRVDYELLQELYPDAALNVFGDVEQVLHTACGINDWEDQTGIPRVYTLTTNYRNTAAIVDFCNKRFDIKMKYIGTVKDVQKPRIVSDSYEAGQIIAQENMVVIVKDRDMLNELCKEFQIEEKKMCFLDTNAIKSEQNEKECYSIFAAKGLEFSNVFVYAKGMTKNQKVVACTRAMGQLYYYA